MISDAMIEKVARAFWNEGLQPVIVNVPPASGPSTSQARQTFYRCVFWDDDDMREDDRAHFRLKAKAALASIDGEWVRKDSDFASGQDQPNLTLDVIIHSDRGFLVAQCLQKDIGAQAATLDKLLVRLRCTIASEAAVAQELGEEPFAAIDPAPAEIWIKAGKDAPEETKIKSLSLSPLGNEK